MLRVNGIPLTVVTGVGRPELFVPKLANGLTIIGKASKYIQKVNGIDFGAGTCRYPMEQQHGNSGEIDCDKIGRGRQKAYLKKTVWNIWIKTTH